MPGTSPGIDGAKQIGLTLAFSVVLAAALLAGPPRPMPI